MMENTVLKIYDDGNKEIERKRRNLIIGYAITLIIHLIVSEIFNFKDNVYIVSIVIITLAYLVLILKLSNTLKVQDVILKGNEIMVSSEFELYTLEFENILSIQKRSEFSISFLMKDGSEKYIKTNRSGTVKLMSTIFSIEQLRDKVNYKSIF